MVPVGPSPSPAPSTFQEDLSGILMPYLREHLHTKWRGKPGTVFSVEMHGSTSSLQSVIYAMGHIGDRCNTPLLRDIPLSRTAEGGGRMFFEILRWNPAQVKRVRTHIESEFMTYGIAVAPRVVLKEADSNIVVAAEAIQYGSVVSSQPLLLSLTSIGFDALSKMQVHSSSCGDTALVYSLKDAEDMGISLSMEGWEQLPLILRELVENQRSAGIDLNFGRDGAKVQQEVIQELDRLGLICLPDTENRKFRLSTLGITSISAGLSLDTSSPAAYCSPSTAIKDCDVYELVLRLTLDEWTHEFVVSGARPLPYNPFSEDDSKKIWYSRHERWRPP